MTECTSWICRGCSKVTMCDGDYCVVFAHDGLCKCGKPNHCLYSAAPGNAEWEEYNG